MVFGGVSCKTVNFRVEQKTFNCANETFLHIIRDLCYTLIKLCVCVCGVFGARACARVRVKT